MRKSQAPVGKVNNCTEEVAASSELSKTRSGGGARGSGHLPELYKRTHARITHLHLRYSQVRIN